MWQFEVKYYNEEKGRESVRLIEVDSNVVKNITVKDIWKIVIVKAMEMANGAELEAINLIAY